MLAKIFQNRRWPKHIGLRQFSGSYDSKNTLIETGQLKELMAKDCGNLTILQAFFDPQDKTLVDPNDPMSIQGKYMSMMATQPGHIPGAKAYPLGAYCNVASPLTLTRPNDDYFIQIAKALDLRINDTFVCYDAGVIHPSCRLAWTLKSFGAKNVHVLNGTLQKWMSDGGPMSTD